MSNNQNQGASIEAELLPCPFCSGKPEFACEEGGFTAYLTVLCRGCGAESGQVRYRSYDNGIHPDTREYVIPDNRKKQAAEIWNRRTPAAQVGAGELPPLPWGDDFEAWLEPRRQKDVAAAFHDYARAAIEADRAQQAGAAAPDDLPHRLAEHDDPRLYREADVLMAEASAEIVRLRAQLAHADHEFKNFHRSLCARFGYTHDERDWKRDQVSLEEHIAAKIAQQGQETDYTVDDSELARKIMVFLGRSTTQSMEPGADPLRDRLAAKIATWRPAAPASAQPADLKALAAIKTLRIALVQAGIKPHLADSIALKALDETSEFAGAQPDQRDSAAVTLICPKCGVDRLREECGNRRDCGMIFEAQGQDSANNSADEQKGDAIG